MKKLLLCLAILVLFSACRPGITMKTVWEEPHFTGIVVAMDDEFLLVRVDDSIFPSECAVSGEAINRVGDFAHGDMISVPRRYALSEHPASFLRGDGIAVYYDAASIDWDAYPAGIGLVHVIVMVQSRLQNEPQFGAVVEEVFDGSMLVRIDNSILGDFTEQANGHADSGLVRVPTDNIEWQDGDTEFSPGDWIIVYYDGKMRQTDPAIIEVVYGIWVVRRE